MNRLYVLIRLDPKSPGTSDRAFEEQLANLSELDLILQEPFLSRSHSFKDPRTASIDHSLNPRDSLTLAYAPATTTSTNPILDEYQSQVVWGQDENGCSRKFSEGQVIEKLTHPEVGYNAWPNCPTPGTADASNRLPEFTGSVGGPSQLQSLSDRGMVPKSPSSSMVAYRIDSAGEMTQGTSSECDHSTPLSRTESETSSGKSTNDQDGPYAHFLDLHISEFRSWLVWRCKSQPFFRHLQHQVTSRQHGSSTSQGQSTDSSPKSTSISSSSSTKAQASGGNKRRHDDTGDSDRQQGKRPDRKNGATQNKSEPTPAPRLICFHKRHDPSLYRKQTYQRFEPCENKGFENMNRL
jgi:hypothetical protein